jgi:retinol dehydrogenase-12
MEWFTSQIKNAFGTSAPSDAVIRRSSYVGVAAAALFALRRYSAGPRNPYKPDLTGRFAIVTGGNGGIGLETVIELARLGATVTIASRDSQKTREAITTARRQSGSDKINASYVDLSDLNSVRAFAKRYLDSGNPLHLLINNAGIMMVQTRRLSPEGQETQFSVNHLAHYLLTRLLIPVLEKSAPARIINLSSVGHALGSMDLDDLTFEKRPYGPVAAYAQSKGANIAFTAELARRLESKGITAYAVHPGSVHTDLMREANASVMIRILDTIMYPLKLIVFKTTAEGAYTSLYCALAPLAKLENGGYYEDCHPGRLYKPELISPSVGEKLWEISAEIVDLPK